MSGGLNLDRYSSVLSIFGYCFAASVQQWVQQIRTADFRISRPHPAQSVPSIGAPPGFHGYRNHIEVTREMAARRGRAG
jgi:hypothetical protein